MEEREKVLVLKGEKGRDKHQRLDNIMNNNHLSKSISYSPIILSLSFSENFSPFQLSFSSRLFIAENLSSLQEKKEAKDGSWEEKEN